jgi:membrane protein required for colicin V production
MNWLDWTLVALLAGAAVRGFFRGFVVEIASLVGLVLGIWAASHFNDRVAAWIGLGDGHEWAAFAITFVAVVVIVHLLAKLITQAMDMAMLGLPNKVAGGFFGMVRSAFVLSILLNLVLAWPSTAGLLPAAAREGSVLFSPVRAFAPLLVPGLDENKWVRKAMDEVRGSVEKAVEGVK